MAKYHLVGQVGRVVWRRQKTPVEGPRVRGVAQQWVEENYEPAPHEERRERRDTYMGKWGEVAILDCQRRVTPVASIGGEGWTELELEPVTLGARCATQDCERAGYAWATQGKEPAVSQGRATSKIPGGRGRKVETVKPGKAR